LSEVIIRSTDTVEDIDRKVRIAAIFGTFQSTLTDFKFVSKKWRDNMEDERLLGVSLTGIMDNKLTSGKLGKEKLVEALTRWRKTAILTNLEFSKKLNVPASAACTATKPSGTVSSLVDSSAGIHARHSGYYIRTARSDKKDPLTQLMIDEGVPHEDDVMRPESTVVFSFPQRSPKSAVFREDLSAIDQLEMWLTYQLHWCDHKPSVTVSVKEDEWLDVGAWVYRNFEWVSGISFLPYADHSYAQAPYQECTREEYDAAAKKMPSRIRWERLVEYEKSDSTTGSQEYACAAGGCDV
jgi:ribonucleoside-diphosphate reductase alpha chain